MKEEVARARKRAMEAAGHQEYISPLGKGFHFGHEGGDNLNTNPYSRNPRQGRHNNVFDVDYEETHYYDTNDNQDSGRVVHARNRVRTRMEERRNRRKEREQERGGNHQSMRVAPNNDNGGCAVM